MRPRRRLPWLLPALAVVGWHIFQGTRPDATFIMEDAGYLGAARVESVADLGRIWTHTAAQAARTFNYRPLGSTVQGLLAGAVGPVPQAFRALNAALLAAIVGVFAALVRRLGASPRAAGALALLLVVHPAVPELVHWAVGSFDLLALLFGLLAMLAATVPGGRGAALAAVGFGAACLSKEAAAPMVLAVVAAALPRGGRHTARVAGLSAAAGGAWLLAYLAVADALPLAATRVDMSIAFAQHVGWLVAVPPDIGGVYHLFDATAWRDTCLGVAVLGVATLLAARARAPAPLLATLALLVPSAIAAPALLAQPTRYLLLPLAVGLALGGPAVLARVRHPLPRRALAGVALLIALLGASRSLPRAAERLDEETMWRADAVRDPNYQHALLAGVHMARRPLSGPEVAEAAAFLDLAEGQLPTSGRRLVEPCVIADWQAYLAWCHVSSEAGVQAAWGAIEACPNAAPLSRCALARADKWGGAPETCPPDRPLCPMAPPTAP